MVCSRFHVKEKLRFSPIVLARAFIDPYSFLSAPSLRSERWGPYGSVRRMVSFNRAMSLGRQRLVARPNFFIGAATATSRQR